MKKIILLVTVCILIVSVFAGCSSGSSSSYDDYSSSSYSYSLSSSDKYALAEAAILDELYTELYFDADDYGFDVDQTRYSVGSYDIEYGNQYKIYGTLTFYDKYGSFKDTGTFRGTCNVFDDGDVSSVSVYWEFD